MFFFYILVVTNIYSINLQPTPTTKQKAPAVTLPPKIPEAILTSSATNSLNKPGLDASLDQSNGTAGSEQQSSTSPGTVNATNTDGDNVQRRHEVQKLLQVPFCLHKFRA